MESRSHIRRQMRQRRLALTARQQASAARKAARFVLQDPDLRRASRVALYLPNDGELDPRPLVQHLWRRGVDCYLPVLSHWQPGRLRFARYSRSTRFRINRFGIPEPRTTRLRHAHELDIILMPLVAFDGYGNRLGMGGGFYDRTLGPLVRRPRLIGMAHIEQYYPRLPAESWDVPLNAIVTGAGLKQLRIRHRNA